MQTIVVKYHPQSGARYAKYSASSSSGIRVYVESEPELRPEENMDRAVRKLCDKLRWFGILLRGGALGSKASDGFVYVWKRHVTDPTFGLDIQDTEIGP